ncbi:dipeptidyl-peptidase-4 [Marinactinospora thermotolerans DSM 45154]|uniref:Dipeptidyl-peptidase-4 n=1 Tax=Marinactinospora thermotolerans DSM 45154 TaxID=1122192 RepID=A0A1T4RNS1_9ACTN|nr:prolyl oligopeptidase family serine peptidase [Marinactinospora thermotolerans]SKA17321.1 dipeptidyl-peptidase-4 [Marinactinospora thermotolerans DSM 45154]
MPSSGPVQDFPRQFARTRRLSVGVPHDLSVSEDGRRVLFLRSVDGTDPADRLWLYEDGRERLLADHGPAGITGYAADAAARVVAHVCGGDLWVTYPDGNATPERVTTAGPVTDPRPSPDGRSIAYATGGSLRLLTSDGEDRLLAASEGPDITYGLSDLVSAGSMGRTRGHWWSPDGTRLLVARTDTSHVQLWHIADPADPAAPPRTVRHPVVGTANADVSLYLFDLDGRRTEVHWDRERYEYLPAVDWDAHGPLITVQSRDQRVLRVLAVDPASGETRLLDETRDPAWVELVPGSPLRTAAGALVTTRDEADTRRLAVDGAPVTPVGLQVRAVLGVQGEKVLFTACEDPAETHVWSWSPGRVPVRISREPGDHAAVIGGGTTVLVSRVGGRDQITVLEEGGSAGRIASLAQRPLVAPAPAFLRLGPRELRTNLYLPTGHEPGSARLPVLLDPYGGQQLLVATRGLGWPSLVSQWFADQGFAVVVTDGRGSPGRGPAWEKAIRGDILTHAVEDQVAALHAAAEHHPDLDLGRVAIRGWSFGGFLAAGALLRRPDVFHAAVAGAPTADQRLYQTHWKERYLGHPEEEPENYDRCSLIADAPLLRRPLLLIHGLDDDNVAFAHTLRLSAALLAAGRAHRVLPLPGTGHRVTREDYAENLLRLQLDFLREVLPDAH